MDKDLEKKIEEAAKNLYADPEYIETWCLGVKSPEAREYWQQEMYTEEDLLDAYRKGAGMGSSVAMRVARGGELNIVSAEEWFEQNKKE